MSALRGCIAAFVGLVGVACGDEEVLAPLGGGGAASSAGSTQEASSGVGGLGMPDPPEPTVREVFQRDPFGNVAEARNLLWDGDFEWESAFGDQYGWLEKNQFGLRQPLAGGECRSGIKCARLGALSTLTGMALSSATSPLYASVWAKPDGVACDEIKVSLFTEGLEANEPAVFLEAPEVDATGWCHFEGIAAQRRDKTYLLVALPAPGASAVIDDAVVRVATAEDAQRSFPRRFSPPSARDVEDVEEAREAVRRHRGPREGAPDPARAAFERWGRGEGRKLLRPVAPAAGGPR